MEICSLRFEFCPPKASNNLGSLYRLLPKIVAELPLLFHSGVNSVSAANKLSTAPSEERITLISWEI